MSWDNDLATFGDLQRKGVEVFSAGLGRLEMAAQSTISWREQEHRLACLLGQGRQAAVVLDLG